MKIVISSNKQFDKFANIFQHAKEINDIFSISVSTGGIFMQGFDKCHICIMEFNLGKEWFDEFEFNDGEDMPNFGINAKVFYRILNTKEDKQKMTMCYNGESDSIKIEFTDGAKKQYNKKFSMSLIDVNSERLEIPDNEQQVEFVIEQSSISSAIDQLIMFDDTANIKSNNEFVSMLSDGQDGEMKIEISTDDLEEFSSEECEDDEYVVDQNFSLKYLKIMCMFNKVAELITIKISNDQPICCYYNINADNESYLRMFLAPKE